MAGNILVVEDDENARGLIAAALTRRGYSVLQASDCHKAVELWTEPANSFDLLLTDVRLEEQDDGFVLAQKLLDFRPQVPVIFISGDKDCFASPAIGQFGDAPFLAKPFDLKRMLTAVTDVLARNSTN